MLRLTMAGLPFLSGSVAFAIAGFVMAHDRRAWPNWLLAADLVQDEQPRDGDQGGRHPVA
jgi:hypothetical protein